MQIGSTDNQTGRDHQAFQLCLGAGSHRASPARGLRVRAARRSSPSSSSCKGWTGRPCGPASGANCAASRPCAGAAAGRDRPARWRWWPGLRRRLCSGGGSPPTGGRSSASICRRASPPSFWPSRRSRSSRATTFRTSPTGTGS
ncbi:hypothetical protein AZ28_1682 [Bordetella pertussis B200]|nr:hypothetical protein AZ28_1682 [Bordetella pertussis B200]